MPRWLLAPINHRTEIWTTYRVQRIAVDASDEREARQQVAKAAPKLQRLTLGWALHDLVRASRRKAPVGTRHSG